MIPSIFETLGVLPSGAQGPALAHDELGHYLAKHYGTLEEKQRAARHALREEIYRDGGESYMLGLIDRLFVDPDVRELRKKFVPLTGFNNITRRICHALATIYTDPARRTVEGDTDATYQLLLEAVRMDERALEISRLLALHRALVVGFRVRLLPNGEREPVLDIASPANAKAITHPNDPTLIIGWAIKTSYRSARGLDVPAWTLWTDAESIQLREDFTVIGDSYQAHAFGVCPWVGVTLGPPAPGFWPGCEGDDLAQGAIALRFQNVLLLKESKSATVQTVVSGDGTLTSRGQAADSEIPAEVAEGQGVTTIDTSMDLSLFRDTADHILTNLALNHGLPPSILNHQGTQSAEARELLMIPLRQMRREWQVPLRRFERQLARVMAAILRVDLPALAFDASRWRIEFAEVDTRLDPIREHELFEKRRAAGLDNSIDFLQRLRPGLSNTQAWSQLDQNLFVETERNRRMRPLQAISGSLGAETPTETPAAPTVAPKEA